MKIPITANLQPKGQSLPPQMRQGGLFVSRSVHSQLVQVAQARNKLIDGDKPCAGCPEPGRLTADLIADEVLAKWLAKQYPGLKEFEAKAKALHDDALAYVQSFHQPNPAEEPKHDQ